MNQCCSCALWQRIYSSLRLPRTNPEKGQTWWSVFSYKPLAVICLIFQVQCGIPHVIRLHMTLDPAASSQYGWRISISVSLGPFHSRMLPGWMDQIKHLLVKFYKTVWLQWVCFVLEVKAFLSEPIQTARWFCAIPSVQLHGGLNE